MSAASKPDVNKLKTDGSWPTETPYDLILEDVESVWASRQPRTGTGGFFQRLFGFCPARRIHVVEYRDADFEKARFADEVLLRAWVCDHSGVRSAPPPGKIEYYDSISTPTPIVRFAVRAEQKCVIIEEHYGPKASECVAYDYAKGDLDFVGIAWKS